MTITDRSLSLASRFLARKLTVETSNMTRLLPLRDRQAETLEALREISNEVADGYLSRADLWAYLSRPEINSEQKRILQTFFSYDSNSRLEEGVHTEFRHADLPNSEANGPHGQAAYLSITPHNHDASLAPIVFVDGLHHSSRVYFETARQLAVRTGRQVFVIDLPTMGGSLTPGNSSVDERDLNQTVNAVIHQEIPANGHIILAGHSLGTIPARDLFVNTQRLQTPVVIDQLVLIAPVPSLADRNLGYQIATSFVLPYAAATVFENAEVSTLRPSLFFNGHPDAEWLTQVCSREYFHNHLIDTARIFLRTYSFPSLAELVQNERVSVVFAENDQLMNLQNARAWQGQGVYFLPNASHSSIAGRNSNAQEIEILLRAMNGQRSPQAPILRASQIQRSIRRDIRLRLFGIGPAPQAGISFQWGTQMGLFTTPALGMSFMTGANFDALASANPSIRGEAYMGLSLHTQRHLPIYLQARGILGVVAPNLEPFAAWEASIRACLEGICPEGFIRQNLTGSSNFYPLQMGGGLSIQF